MRQLLEELDVVAELTKRCVDENSSTALDQGDYLARYNGLVERYDKAQNRVKELERKRTERMAKADAIGGFMPGSVSWTSRWNISMNVVNIK